GKTAKNKAPREKRVRLAVIAAIEKIAAKLHRMAATDHREVVGDLSAARDGQVGQEDLRAQIRKPRDVQSNLPGRVGDHVKIVVTPLRAGFVLSRRAELVIPGSLNRMVIVVDGTAPREARQGLHIGILFAVAPVSVPDGDVVGLVEMVVKAT